MELVMQLKRKNGDTVTTRIKPMLKNGAVHRCSVERIEVTTKGRHISSFFLDDEEEAWDFLRYLNIWINGEGPVEESIIVVFKKNRLEDLYV